MYCIILFFDNKKKKKNFPYYKLAVGSIIFDENRKRNIFKRLRCDLA